MTMKYRLPLPAFRGKVLPPEAEAFVRDTYADHYGKPFVHPLRAALDIRYNRITLVARDGRERMTIDTDLSFRGDISRVDIDATLAALAVGSRTSVTHHSHNG